MHVSRIFVTGDIHLNYDIRKLNTKNFPEQKNLTKDDYLIICGDTALTWDETNETKYWVKWLNNKSFTTLWVDGNHENYDLLYKMPTESLLGGKVHKISSSIYHLKRGEIYTVNGKKIFTMGGAMSNDKGYRKEGKSWWPQELPSNEEIEYGIQNLQNNNNKVDYIITHDSGIMYKEVQKDWIDLYKFLKYIEKNVIYKSWYFGHHHKDLQVDAKHRILYNEIIEIS